MITKKDKIILFLILCLKVVLTIVVIPVVTISYVADAIIYLISLTIIVPDLGDWLSKVSTLFLEFLSEKELKILEK